MRSSEQVFGNYLQPAGQASFGVHKLLLTALAAGLMGVLSSSAMFAPSSPPFFRLPAAAAIIAVIFILTGFRVGKFSTWRLLSLVFWIGYALTSLISALIHRDTLLPEVWQFAGVPLILFMSFPRSAKRYGNVMVLSAIILAFAPYVLYSLVRYPIFTPYSGVFLNSNMFGMVVSTISAALFALLRGALNSRRFSVINMAWQMTLIVGLACSLILIFLSGSRTSFITFILMGMIFAGSLFFNVSRNRCMIALTVTAVISVTLYILGSAAMNITSTGFVDTLVNKFLNKLAQGDTTGGRLYIWKLVLSNIQLMGMGNGIFFEQPAHNTYIMILATKGPIAVAFMVAVHLITLVLAVRRVFYDIRSDGYAIGPLLVVINYLVMGFAENVFGTLGNGINISFLLMAGVLFNEGQYLHREHRQQEMQAG